MLAIARSTVLAPATSPLVFYAQARGTMVDLVALSFAIYDLSDDTKKLTPVKVFPSGASQAVAIAGADKLGTGRYTASGWTVSGSAPPGVYEIRWFYQMPPQPDENGDLQTQPTVEVRQQFEVVTAGQTIAPYYCLLADIRDEGITAAQFSDARVMLAIQRASQFVERVTGRFFEPRFMQVRQNGRGSSVTLFDMPIIGVQTLRFQTSPLFPSDLAVEPDFYRVYNRHLQGQIHPDDRNDPKIELFSASEDLAGVRPFSFSRLIFPRGQQNVTVTGVWGYTEFDGSPFGTTPGMLRRAVQLLTLRELPKFSQWDKREDATKRWRLTSERTRDQQYNLEPLKLHGAFTGDPEIDTILESYVRPPAMGAA